MVNPLILGLAQFQLLMLVLVRVTGLVIASPVFGSNAIPIIVKIHLSLMLSLILFPLAATGDFTPPGSDLAFGWMAARELMIGLVIGFIISLAFAGVQLAGEVVDMQIGFSIVNVINPSLETQVPVMGFLYFILATLLLLMLNGHHLILMFLAETFQELPVGQPLDVDLDRVWETAVAAGSAVFKAGVTIAAPVLIVLMMTSFAFGFMGRTAQQINLMIVGFPLRVGVGLIIVALTIEMFLQHMRDIFQETWNFTGSMLQAL